MQSLLDHGTSLTHLLLSPSDREKQSTTPPRIHSAEPPQPMNRAAPSSYLGWDKDVIAAERSRYSNGWELEGENNQK